MKSMRGLGRKLHRLEGRVGINQLPDLPEDLQAFYIFYQKEGQPDEEIDAEIEAELKEADEARVKAQPSPFVLRMRAKGRL